MARRPTTRTRVIAGGIPWAGRIRLAVEIVAAYSRARWAMRGGDLRHAVAKLRSAKREHAASFDRAGCFHLAGAVRRVLSLLPGDARCLTESLALLALLDRRGVSAILVIGVRAEPEFGAHAWVELGGEALLPAGAGEFCHLAAL